MVAYLMPNVRAENLQYFLMKEECLILNQLKKSYFEKLVVSFAADVLMKFLRSLLTVKKQRSFYQIVIEVLSIF